MPSEPAAHCRAAPTRRYISESGASNLPKYRYVGVDDSFMYRYFCSPFAEALVRRFLPVWVAPNTITCIGLLPSLFGHSVIWYYSRDFRGRCPRWCWALNSLCTFVYQTLDNMDGKQARRTGTSSSLGLLLDHGVDALNIILSALNVMCMLQAGSSPFQCLVIWLNSAAPFFFATWEEFHTGSLYLGVVNGPTDGVLILCGAYAISATSEDYSQFWDTEVAFGVSRRSCIIGFYSVCVLATVAGNMASVANVHRRHATGPEPQEARPRMRDALNMLAPFCLLQLGFALWLSTPAGRELHAEEPRLVFWLPGLIFLLLVTQLQLAHICGEPYQPWSKVLLLPLLSFSSGAAVWLPGALPADWARQLLGGCVLLALVAWSHYVWHVPREMAAVLGIRIFSITTPGPEKKE